MQKGDRYYVIFSFKGIIHSSYLYSIHVYIITYGYTLLKLNKKRNEQIKKNQKNEPKPIQGKRGSVPIAPPPPPPPPSVPTAVPKIPSISVNSSSKPKPEVSLADELKNIKLTKVRIFYKVLYLLPFK